MGRIRGKDTVPGKIVQRVSCIIWDSGSACTAGAFQAVLISCSQGTALQSSSMGALAPARWLQVLQDPQKQHALLAAQAYRKSVPGRSSTACTEKAWLVRGCDLGMRNRESIVLQQRLLTLAKHLQQ